MITVVEEGIFSVPNAVSEISATVGKAWRSRDEVGEKAEPSSAGVLCVSPWPSGEGLPRAAVLTLSSRLTASWPGSFRSPQEDKQVLREQIVPQRKEARLSQGRWGPVCWLPGPPAITTSVLRCSVSIRGP